MKPRSPFETPLFVETSRPHAEHIQSMALVLERAVTEYREEQRIHREWEAGLAGRAPGFERSPEVRRLRREVKVATQRVQEAVIQCRDAIIVYILQRHRVAEAVRVQGLQVWLHRVLGKEFQPTPLIEYLDRKLAELQRSTPQDLGYSLD